LQCTNGSRQMMSGRCSVLLLLFVLLFSISVSFGYCNGVGTSAASDPDQLTATFVEGVAGLNMSTYPILSSDVAVSRLPNSQHIRTDVRIVLGNGSRALEAVITLVDNKLWNYKLRSLGEPLDGSKTLNECLAIADVAVGKYRDLFNAGHSNGMAQMLSDAIRNQNLTVENSDALLSVSQKENCSTPLDYERYTTLQWYKKIVGQFTSPLQSIWISISKSGLLTGFTDNLATHYIASTTINVSEEQALNISKQYAEAYAAEHGQKIVGAGATLKWDYDADSQRGDDFAVYPMWVFEAQYNETKQGVYGYGVLMWADNGQIIRDGPRVLFEAAERTGNISNGYFWVFLGVTLVALVLTCSGTFVRRRTNSRKRVSR